MTTKQKNIRDYIIGLSIICVLVIALIIQGKYSDGDDNENTEETGTSSNVVFVEGRTITDLTTDDIQKVEYTLKGKDKVVFEKESENWVINNDKNFPLSVDSFKKQFLQKYVDGQVYDVVEGYESLADYGIEEPEVTLVVTDKSGNVRTYMVGGYNGVIGAYYMYHKEENKLYTASSDFLYICRENIYDFAGIDKFPSFTTDSLEKLVMNNDQKKVELVYMEDGHETDPFGNSQWFILSPFNFYRACDAYDISEKLQDLFTGLGFSQKADYYATDEELESYGLLNSNRYYEIVYRFDDDEYEYQKVNVKVLFGNYNEEEDGYYSRVIVTQGMEVDAERARSINFVSRAAADKVLNLDPIDYIYPFVLYVPMKEFAGGGITVTKDDGTVYKVEYEADYKEGSAKASNEKIILNDKEADVKAFKEFYYQFTKIYVNRPIYAADKIVTDEPTYTVNYDRNEDDYYGDAVVEYRIFDSTYYQVTINGKVDALAVRRDVDKAMSMLAELK